MALFTAHHGALFVGHDEFFGEVVDIVEILNGIIFRFAEDFDGDKLVDDFPEVAGFLDVPCVEHIDGTWPEAVDERVTEETAEVGPLYIWGLLVVEYEFPLGLRDIFERFMDGVPHEAIGHRGEGIVFLADFADDVELFF